MIQRSSLKSLLQKLDNFSSVGLIGPRQVGKTTLAFEAGKHVPSVYLDLENPMDLAQLDDPIGYFQRHQGKLIILDEIQRKPELFPVLRSVIDQNRRKGLKTGQFLILGSASVELLRQSSESLAGRIIYEEMPPVLLTEYDNLPDLWLKGGFPDSLTADAITISMQWRTAFVKTYLERDIPFFNPRVPAETIGRLWTMLAHMHGATLNVSRLASSLGISGQTVSRYIDLLQGLFLIKQIPPYRKNTGKRITKSPKTYISDSGILHTILQIESMDALNGHPIAGASWEGFVIQNVLGRLGEKGQCFFYRTSGGAEIDLIIKHNDGRLIAAEIKKNSVPHLERGFYEACSDVKPDEKYVIYTGMDSFYMRNEVLAIGLKDFLMRIS
ncbi:MAG: ATP-binding protein [Ekhidna sp.]